MRLLLDSHVLIWSVMESERSNPVIVEQIRTADQVCVSIVGLWEIKTKVALKRLSVPDDFFETVPTLGYDIVPITPRHIDVYGRLPFHHRDPFDRMMVAQAFAEELTLVTADRYLAAYGGKIMLAA